MVMLVFFPRTLYLVFWYPQRMINYADTELGDVQSEQYDDTLSPPLFLMICLALDHLIEQVFPTSDQATLPAFLQETQNLLMFRVFMLSLLPLVLSLRLLAKLGIALNRETLRPAFFNQCFVTAPIALMVGLATGLWRIGDPTAAQVATVIFCGGTIGHLVQQALWFRAKLDAGYGVAALNAFGGSLLTVLLIVMTALVIGFVSALEAR